MSEYPPPLTAQKLTALLSNQEFEVAKRFATGMSHSEIAADMQLSTSTIGTHRDRLLKKLKPWGVTGNARLAILMFQVGAVGGVIRPAPDPVPGAKD